MKRIIISLAIILLFLSNIISAQEQFYPQPKKQKHSPTSIGMVIYSNDVETVWNVFRLANHSKIWMDPKFALFLLWPIYMN